MYCKAQLSRMGLKPKNPGDYQTHKVFGNAQYTSGWREYNFYKLDNTTEKRKVNNIVKDIPATPGNLCEALHIISESAKKSRDTAQISYCLSNYAQAKQAKWRKSNLYDLKDKIIALLSEDNILSLQGYYIQRATRCKSNLNELSDINYLAIYTRGTFCFYTAVKGRPENMEYLGEFRGLIPQDTNIPCSLKFKEAEKLLRSYYELSLNEGVLPLFTTINKRMKK